MLFTLIITNFVVLEKISCKMKRKIYNSLLAWKADSDRKPLILEGARQGRENLYFDGVWQV